MSLHLTFKHWLMIIAPIAVAATAVAWSGGETYNPQNHYNPQDTVPVKEHRKAYHRKDKETGEKDLDKELKQLDKDMQNLDGRLENMDWGKIDGQIEKAMEKLDKEMEHHELDMEKMQKDIENAMKDIDFKKIEEETNKAVQQARENIDFNKIEKDIQQSLEEVKKQLNSEEFRKSLDAAKHIDMTKIKESLSHARLEMEMNKVDIKEEMHKAKEEIKKAKEELKGYREMLDEMEDAGLIDTNEDYSIEYKNGDLYINNQKQSQDVLSKYRKYFEKDNSRIYKKNGRFNINID
jgi:chromosome segregation ATPase